MNDQYVRNVIEAALLAAGRPLAADELVGLFDERDGSAAEEVTAAIESLRADYETRGFELVEIASGYRIQIRTAFAQPVSRLWQERPAKYSRAMLETLALVAYRQPITRGEIEQVRGVAVNPNIIKTLLERGWIRVIGHRDVPGKPELLGTTREFLDYFSLKKLDDLPTLAQLKELEELRVQLSLPGADPVAEPGDERLRTGRAAAPKRSPMRVPMRKSWKQRRRKSRGRKAWSPAVPATTPTDETAPVTQRTAGPQRCGARCRARAKTAGGRRRRVAARSGALDPRRASADQRRGSRAGGEARRSRSHHPRWTAGPAARGKGRRSRMCCCSIARPVRPLN